MYFWSPFYAFLLYQKHVDSFIISIICIFVPCLQFVSLQRGLQNHTFVAILRGYSASLEEEINKLINQELFIYNSKLIDKYIASQKVINSKGVKHSVLSTALIHYILLIVCVCFYIYYNSINNIYVIIGAMVWYVFCFYFITKLCIDFKKKEQKRFESKDFAKNLFDLDK